MEDVDESKLEVIPRHIAIIPDGNRRWATERGLEPWQGHEAGAEKTKELIREARRLGIREISFWGSSLENLKKRPLRERQALLQIYTDYFTQLLDNEDIHRDKARLRFIGRWEEQFPQHLKEILHRLEEATKSYDQYYLNFFLAYSGDDDMLGAFRAAVADIDDPKLVTPEKLKSYLMTRDLPPVDLLIRTGDDPHLSAGFMMWETANSQLFFADVFYPDFGPKELGKALSEYQSRERRYGK